MSTVVLTRVAVETISPLAIYSGDRETLGQNAIVRDWNGLPCIPATAIAGVWSHTVRNISQKLNPIKYLHWFGHDGFAKDEKRMASRIVVTDGLLLDKNSCLPGEREKHGQLRMLTDPKKLAADPVYSLVSINQSSRYERTCCRINERKANHNAALFTAKNLPKGLRFAFDIKFELDSEADLQQYRDVLKIIGSRSFALGSKTANGQGSFKIIGAELEEIRLEDYAKNPEEAAKKIRSFTVNRKVKITAPNETPVIASEDQTGLRCWKFRLSSQSSMRIGSGHDFENFTTGEESKAYQQVKPLSEMEKDSGKNVQTCFTDARLLWNGENFAKEIQEFIIPGSTIKGALAHRTMYHFLRRRGWFADTKISDDRSPRDLIRDLLDNREPPKELEPYYTLFGRNDPVNHDNMRAGSLRVQDAVIKADYWLNRMHNKLDRYTSGVMPSALFAQMRLLNPSFEVNITLLPSRADELPENAEIMQAFQDALYDLKHGYLNICAGSGRDTAVFKEAEEKKAGK
ncbi:RAMP superfamily CRISPR-associated protein [Succinimonas sp.]|uniref:RAMP superfamily CRISPR-associated protein n=1 Tax=Succinimonas sp. TaxID=1936151 RepID=UPI003864D12D